jgi:hypothetical protein
VAIDVSANKEIFSISISRERNMFVVAERLLCPVKKAWGNTLFWLMVDGHSIPRTVGFETKERPYPFILWEKRHRENNAMHKGQDGYF